MADINTEEQALPVEEVVVDAPVEAGAVPVEKPQEKRSFRGGERGRGRGRGGDRRGNGETERRIGAVFQLIDRAGGIAVGAPGRGESGRTGFARTDHEGRGLHSGRVYGRDNR